MDKKTEASVDKTRRNTRISAGHAPIEILSEYAYRIESSYTGTPTFSV